MNKVCAQILSFVLVAFLGFTLSYGNSYRKALWVWNTDELLGISTEENKLINECIASGITDIYLFIQYNDELVTRQLLYQKFIEKCYCNNVRIWGMNGYRSYFSDQCGPTYYYQIINAVVAYNAKCSDKQKFVGFSGDNEFNQVDSWDCTTEAKVNVFHNGLADVALSTKAGTGFWKSTQKQDRDSLLTDWVRQTHTAATICHNGGIEYGVAVMNWITGINSTNAAMGNQRTPLYATYKGVTKALYKHILDYVDEYIIMSYHTNVVSKVMPMCKDVLDYTNTLPSPTPRILSAVETHCGVDTYVSYCDTPKNNTKADVSNGINYHFYYLGPQNSSYAGVAIHDWKGGYQSLSPASVSTTSPSCVLGLDTFQENLFTLTPHPTTNHLEFKLCQVFEPVSVAIVGLDGQMHKEMICQPNAEAEIQTSIDLSTMAYGIYLLKVTGSTTTQIFKFTKQ